MLGNMCLEENASCDHHKPGQTFREDPNQDNNFIQLQENMKEKTLEDKNNLHH